MELTGGLPCIRCTYDLKGLSVRGVCPECGTPIRATILARVDPLAKELQPIYTPKLTAGFLVLWTVAGLGAAVAAWVPRAIEGASRIGPSIRQPTWPAAAVLTCAVLSAIGAIALIRPHARIRPLQSCAALVAVALYAPLIWILLRINFQIDIRDPSPYLGVGGIDPARATWRLAADALLIAILLALRPNARVLAARSFVLRTGRVDRQTMLAMVAAVGVCTIGDILAIVAATLRSSAMAPGSSDTLADVLRIAAMLFIGVGSLLVTLGLGGMVLDALRLVPVIAERPLALSDVARQTPKDQP